MNINQIKTNFYDAVNSEWVDKAKIPGRSTIYLRICGVAFRD